jgi:hypothetical protein
MGRPRIGAPFMRRPGRPGSEGPAFGEGSATSFLARPQRARLLGNRVHAPPEWRSEANLDKASLMKGLLVTIVDVFGIFIPGALLAIALLAFPPVTAELIRGDGLWLTGLRRVDPLVAGTGGFIVACALGFVNRLWAVKLCQGMTSRRWSDKLRSRTADLNPAIERYLRDCKLAADLGKLAGTLEENEPGRCAPYFHYAKRLIRANSSALWSETERLEAEIRFTAGLLVPLAALAFDGLYAAVFQPAFLPAGVSLLAGVGAVAVVRAFPSRRVREVQYVYLMAIIVLKGSYLPRPDGPDSEPGDET